MILESINEWTFYRFKKKMPLKKWELKQNRYIYTFIQHTASGLIPVNIFYTLHFNVI